MGLPLTENDSTQALISTRAAVMAVGGAEDKENDRAILAEFWRRSGGREASLVVIPAASGIPDVLGDLYHRIFTDMGTPGEQVRILDVRNPVEARNPAALELIKTATGIYFTGGDQERLSDVLGHSELMQAITERWQRGDTVIAGTSAGASALGKHMISRGYSGEPPSPGIVTVKTGLGFLPELIVDQHFHNRNRLARLLTAVAYHPECLGLGVDEDTAAIIQGDNILEVIGSGSVTVVDGQGLQSTVRDTAADRPYALHGVKLHLLVAGSRFDLAKRAVI